MLAHQSASTVVFVCPAVKVSAWAVANGALAKASVRKSLFNILDLLCVQPQITRSIPQHVKLQAGEAGLRSSTVTINLLKPRRMLFIARSSASIWNRLTSAQAR
jgi:hypothetical protein